MEPARSFSIESVGARFGFPANSTANRLNQAEIFSNFNLPWVWNLGRGIELQSRLDLSLGWLGGRGHDAAVGTLGPSLILSYGNFPVHLDFGSSPTVLSRHTWARADIGGDFQFSSHAGIDWDITSHVRLGYRLVHMSSAGIEEPNPGINMHMVALSYVF